MAKVLLVDDDRPLCSNIESWLTYQNYLLECAHTGEQANSLLELYEYDLIILDWRLPDLSGLDICRRYRAKGGKAPILMLTGKQGIEDKELGLDSGADDYLTKPFDLKELSARLRALLRRPATLSENVLKFADVRLDPLTREVTRAGASVKLYPKEFALLEYLMRHPNIVVTTEQLIDHVWNSEAGVGGEGVRTCIKRLRKQLDLEGQQSLIENVHGVGYKLRLPE